MKSTVLNFKKEQKLKSVYVSGHESSEKEIKSVIERLHKAHGLWFKSLISNDHSHNFDPSIHTAEWMHTKIMSLSQLETFLRQSNKVDY